MDNLVDVIILTTREYIDSGRNLVLQAEALANTTASAEVIRLREQNMFLTQLLEFEKLKADKARDGLIRRLSGTPRSRSRQLLPAQFLDCGMLGYAQLDGKPRLSLAYSSITYLRRRLQKCLSSQC